MDHVIPEVVELAVDKFCDYVQVDHIPFAPGHIKDKVKRFFEGWHVTVATSGLIAFVVLVANICLLIWSEVAHIGSVSDGALTLFEGDCSHMKKIFTWSHVGINILSTLLLAASNTSCQVLSAPTREEVDVAHNAGHWLDIGVSSFRNLRFVALKRLVVFLLLAASSIPIHLIYNSVIFPTTTANNNFAAYVTKQFVNGTSWNHKAVVHNTSPGHRNVDILDILQKKAVQGELVHLSNIDCLSQFFSTYVSEYRNFLVVVQDLPDTSEIVLQAHTKTALTNTSPYWFCNAGSALSRSHRPHLHRYRCGNAQTLQGNSPNWWLERAKHTRTTGRHYVQVEHCLAEPSQQKCTISLSRWLLVAVILCNFVKLVCFILVVRWGDKMPLVTVGDAIDSFLRNPDDSTSNLGTVTALDVRKGVWRREINCPAEGPVTRPWSAKRHLWFSAAGWKRWTFVGFCLLTLYLPAVIFLPWLAFSGAGGWGNISKMGAITQSNVIGLTRNWNIPAEVVFVNLPQLILSFGYVLFNNVLTSSLQASECADYAKHRKGLRVTSSKDQQRSTYWLQVPYRYAVPIMGFWMVVHWLTSQAMFLARVDIHPYYPAPSGRVQSRVNGCGFSPIPIVMVFCLLGGMLLVSFGMGFRRFPRNIPLMSSCSVAIAAACHASQDEGEEMASMPLQYGVLKARTLIDGVKYQRAGFSSEEVEELIEGEVYR